ncbi:MAG: retropepsin-like aspartic protease [Pirellulales bacterium]
METATVGRVLAEAKIENLTDLRDADRNMLPRDQVRMAIVPDALVDTGSTTLALPTRLIHQLGLQKAYEKRARTSAGTQQINVFDAVRLTLLDRYCTVDVMEVPDDVPVLIGQIPLEMLDLVVDSQGRQLIGNPAHNGEHVLELY